MKNVQTRYKIDVEVTPNLDENKHKPFFWVLWSKQAGSEGEPTNEGCGWAESPTKAWEEANNLYLRKL